MPFVTYKVQSKALSGGTGLSVSLKKLRSAPAVMSIQMSAAVAGQLKLSDGDHLLVLLGTESDHGMIRLVKMDSGSTSVKQREAGRGGVYFTISLGHVPAFVNRSEPKRYCQFEEIEEGGFEIVLPTWADETNPTKPKITVSAVPRETLPRPPASRPVLGQRLTSLTRSLAGDPPPGRSALEVSGVERVQRQTDMRRKELDARRESEAGARSVRAAERQSAAGKGTSFSENERKILNVLSDGWAHSKQQLLSGVTLTSAASLLSTMSVLRRKLRIHSITIENVDGGFQMKPEMAERAKALLG